MFTKSIWHSFSAPTNFPRLQEDIEVDVAIIGGGITGITAAQLLSEAGLSVAVLEARKVGGGTTSHSTGNLYFTIDQVLSSLQSKYDNQVIRDVVTSRQEALELISNNVERLSIDCDFQRVPWILYSESAKHNDKIDQELETAKEAGVVMEPAEKTDIPFHVERGVRVGGQAQFNPMRYVQGLAMSIESPRCRIFENTRVTRVEEKDDVVILDTLNHSIRAKNCLEATHTPKGVEVQYHTVLGPYREYGVAAKLAAGTYPEGIFWGFYHNGEKISFRSYKRGEDQYIMAIGQPHKVGQADNNQKHLEKLEIFLKDHFEISQITHRWGGQHYKPADKLPYIGKKKDGSNIYVATGFSTDGLVYGTLSAMLIRDQITNKTNPYSERYAASRFTPLKSAKDFVKENINVAVQYLKDLPFSGSEAGLDNLKIGEGKIISKDGHKIAACRNELGELKMHSAFCTHLACVVHWNNAEKTWDCPCHGSRFDTDGMVLEGPALHPLSEIREQGEHSEMSERE